MSTEAKQGPMGSFEDALALHACTPGPWMIFGNGDIGSAAVRIPETIVLRAGSVKGQTIGEACQNARLIARAPEMADQIARLEAEKAELLEALWKLTNEAAGVQGFVGLSGLIGATNAKVLKERIWAARAILAKHKK